MAYLKVLAQRDLLALSRHHSQDVRALGVISSKFQAPNAVKALTQVRLHCLWTLALQPMSNTVILCKACMTSKECKLAHSNTLLCISRLLLLRATCTWAVTCACEDEEQKQDPESCLC